MVEFMAFRGPDAQEVWTDSAAGFGHALLQTTDDTHLDCQPASLDGRVWIVADARVDARADLLQRLSARGEHPVGDATDAELILHAYRAWGEACLDHLLGDFSFAIWDGPGQRLFCARDHLGVKPFYYARVENSLVFSNTLEAVRLHPGISDALDDRAIGDFLLFDLNQDPAATVFARIRRLPAAHTLTLDRGELRLHRYWTLPIEEPLRYRRPGDYVEHFLELLQHAVGDRLRTSRVGVQMSGGLDSTSVAATARRLLAARGPEFRLGAHTAVYDRLIPDRERHYAGVAAQELDIPIQYLVADDYRLYERWDQPELRQPEPKHWPLDAVTVDLRRQIAAYARVALTGSGVDPSLRVEPADITAMVNRLEWGELLVETTRYAIAHRRVPRIGLRSALRQRTGRPHSAFPYPGWLQPGFAARLELAARWEHLNRPPDGVHPYRPGAYALLGMPVWPDFFEQSDPGVTGLPLEERHPYFDLRVVRYVLSLPLLPWCLNKELLRTAMRGILPEPVRMRAKTTVADNLFNQLLQQSAARHLDQLDPAPGLAEYVEVHRLPAFDACRDLAVTRVNLRPWSLNYWLARRQTGADAVLKEKCYATYV